MALVTNIAGAAGTTSGSSSTPTDSGGITGLLAALTAMPGSAISPQPTLAAQSASGHPGVPTLGGIGSAGTERQMALWAKVFDFYQHVSVDAESALGAGQTLSVSSAQDTSRLNGVAQAATTQAAVTKTSASGMETGSLAATESTLAASPALPTLYPAAAAQAKVISIQAGIAATMDKTFSPKVSPATKNEASATQKSAASPTMSSGMHLVAPVPLIPGQSVPAQSNSAQPSLVSPGGLALGASVVDAGLAGGREVISTTLPQAIKQPVESGAVPSGPNPPGQLGAQPGNSGNFSAAMAQTTYAGVNGAAKPEIKWAPPAPPAVATMRLPELAAGERSLSAASTQLSATSSASPSLADVAGKPASSTTPSPSASNQAVQTGSGAGNSTMTMTASGATASSLPSSPSGTATQGQDLSSASTAVSASGSGSGHSSTSDASSASKSVASMHGVIQSPGGAPQAGTLAATMASHPGENPSMVMGATVTGSTPGASSGAASATPANGPSAPAQHPGQVFESLDASTGAWNPAQTARLAPGGASLSVGYQDARLGYVELQARQVAGGVQATLVPSSEAARQALEGQLGSLGGWLAQRATPVDRLAVGMPSSMAAMTTDHGGAMNPGGAMNSGGAMDQGRTPNPNLMQSMAQAAQQGLAGGASERGLAGGSRQSEGGDRPGPNAVGAVGGVASGSLVTAGYDSATLNHGSADQAMQNEMRVEAARIGVGQTISVRA